MIRISNKLRSSLGRKRLFAVIGLVLAVSTVTAYFLSTNIRERYENLQSNSIVDRNSNPIVQRTNLKQAYSKEIYKWPPEFEELLIQKEDRFFYYHPGVNPFSTVRATTRLIKDGKAGGSSTITQQLVKILLGNEKDRTALNKLKELAYSLSLELFSSKKDILTMYINSAYLGNQAQGFEMGANLYFDKSVDELSQPETLQLLATLSSPSRQNPWRKENQAATAALSSTLGEPEWTNDSTIKRDHRFQTEEAFEVRTLDIACESTCQLSLDQKLTSKIRNIVKENVLRSYDRGVRSGAVVVIKLPENELLAIVGSPDPNSPIEGSMINMAIEPRPVGSTIKPFIYGKAFELGLRPYTLTEDREYKYPIATGFPLYPKNYDGQYRGEVSLHEALSNSLNVPTIKVLEYVGLDTFYDWFEHTLEFSPIQDWESYQYGIALGGLEMDLLSLSHLFTIFPNQGTLKPLRVSLDHEISLSPAQSHKSKSEIVLDPTAVELVNKILSDRLTGVNQFGLKSNLNLSSSNYAVKTGTSRDFHDSWVVGYTPDFLVGVWLGNAENTALMQVSGQTGAGGVWHDVMQLLLESEYDNQNQFDYPNVTHHDIDGSVQYGLVGDDVDTARDLMLQHKLILKPFNNDSYEFTTETAIPLNASSVVDWYVDGKFLDRTASTYFKPAQVGTYDIEAIDENRSEIITVKLIEES